jgi:hypothetical protein
MEPTTEQLRRFYGFVRQAVLLSQFIQFVEPGEDQNLYVYVGNYDSNSVFVVYITPTGEVEQSA